MILICTILWALLPLGKVILGHRKWVAWEARGCQLVLFICGVLCCYCTSVCVCVCVCVCVTHQIDYPHLFVHFQYLCLLCYQYLEENLNRVCHMNSHWLEINPSSSWDIPWNVYGRTNISHLTFSPSSQQGSGVRFLRNETLRYFLNKGGISDTYNAVSWWK